MGGNIEIDLKDWSRKMWNELIWRRTEASGGHL
jgi:hypothetical protein